MHGVQPWGTAVDRPFSATNQIYYCKPNTLLYSLEKLHLVGFSVSSTMACELAATGDAVQISSDMCR